MTLDSIFESAQKKVESSPGRESFCLWPEEFSCLSAESAYKFVQLCRTWDEAGQMVRPFPDKEYLRELAREWVLCRLEGRPLIIEKSRRLVVSWFLRALELYDLGLRRGNGLITHTKRDDAAGHVWRIWFLYDDLRRRYPAWKLRECRSWGNEVSQTLDKLVLPNQSSVSQYFEKPSGLQGSGFSWVTLEELAIYGQPAGMYDQASRLVQSAPGMVNGLITVVTNVEFSDGYEMVIAGASESPY